MQTRLSILNTLYYTGHIIASYYFQSLIGLANFHILLQISYFKRLTREHEIYNYVFVVWLPFYPHDKKATK